MSEPFSREDVRRGRKTFHSFMSFNVIAFSILTGNLISVFALKLNVSNTYIGLLQSFMHLSMVFILIGRILMQRMRSTSVFALGWFLRYVFASFLLIIPWVVRVSGRPALATIAILVATAGFHIFRGIGVAGQVPVVAGLSAGPDRGGFLSVNAILANAIALGGGVAIAITLGEDAPLSRFVVVFGLAIASGFVSVLFVRKLPEPRGAGDASFAAFLRDVTQVGANRRVVRLLLYLTAFGLGTSALMAFLVVLAKRVFELPDNFSILLVAIGNLGAILTGVMNRRLVDDVGAKPLIGLYQATTVVAALAVAVLLPLVSGSGSVLMMLLFFFGAAARSGVFTSTQAYFYGSLPADTHRNLGMLYSLVTGAAGAVGSYLAGPLLDLVADRQGNTVAFQVLYGLIAVIAVAGLIVAASLPPDGRERVRRGWRGIIRTVRRWFR